MNTNPVHPLHQKDTEWQGELNQFTGEGLSPDDPMFQARNKVRRPALGLDLDGTLDEAPDFFRLLARMWPGPVIVITYRENEAKAKADVAKYGVDNAQVILVNSFAEKAEIINRHNIKVYFDDMDEVLLHIPADVTVFKIRNRGNFCFGTRKWLYSKITGKQL